MEISHQSDTDYNVSQIHTWAPEDIWIHIIAHSDEKGIIRQTCSYFRNLASTKNEKLFLQRPLVIVPEVLNRFALFYADFENNMILNNLLYHGADPNNVDDNGMSVMKYVVKNGNLDMVKTLLNHPDFDATNMAKDYRSPLLLAARYKYESMVDHILSHCTVDYDTMLFLAIQYDLPSFIEKLLPYASKVEQVKEVDMAGCKCNANHKEGLLHSAAVKGYVNLVQKLIEQGTPVDSKNSEGFTPFSYAITHNSTDMINLLIKNNANVNSVNKQLYTPLHHAAKNGSITRVQFLLNHGADINAKTRYNGTSLHLAAEQGHVQIVQLLLAHNVNVNERNRNANTALHEASSKYQTDIMKLLLQRPDIDLFTGLENKSLLYIIIKHNWVPFYRVNKATNKYEAANDLHDLFIKKSDINEINKIYEDGQSLLSYALLRTQIPMIRTLLEQPTITIINTIHMPELDSFYSNSFKNQGTPLDIALHMTRDEPEMQKIVDLLKKLGAKTRAQLEKDGLIERT